MVRRLKRPFNRLVIFSSSGMQVVNLDHEHGIPMLPVTVPEGSSCNLNDCDTQQMSLGLGQQHRLTRSLVSVGSIVCRICHTNTSKEPLISPCRCKGSLAYVHLACLERWLNQSCRSYCELCRYHFNVIETPRYRCDHFYGNLQARIVENMDYPSQES